MNLKIVFILISLFTLTLAFNCAQAEVSKVSNFKNLKASRITSYSAAVIDNASGELLFGKRENEKKPVASITKIIGAYVFLSQNPNLDKNAKMLKGDEVGGGRLRLPIGTTTKIKNFLYSSLIGSANNSATALIRLSGLGKSTFINRMNHFASEAGADDTNFVDACGISPSNRSTAYELAVLGRKVFENNLICSISARKTYSFSINGSKGKKTITHTSAIVKQNSGTFKVMAAKTGYLPEVGNNLIVKLSKKSNSQAKIIIVTFGAKSQSAASRDITTLAKWAFDNFRWQ